MAEEGKLIIEIKNSEPVELADLTHSLFAVSKEYSEFTDRALDGFYRTETKLYVKQISTGSIITELQPYAAGLLPIISDFETILGFARHLQIAIEWLLKPHRNSRPPISRQTLENVSSIVEPVAKDSASQMNISTVVNNYAPIHITLNSQESNAIQRQVLRELESLKEPTFGHHHKVVMYWYQARDDLKSGGIGDRAIIESMSPRPTKVVFLSDATKALMLRADENPFRYAFVVDVDVETIDGRPVLYRVVQLHDRFEKDL